MKSIWNKPYTFVFFKKSIKYLILHFSMLFIVPPSIRTMMLSFIGIKFKNRKTVFVGSDVLFDTVTIGKTYIGENVYITSGVKILNHFLVTSEGEEFQFIQGDVIIEDNVFIGMNSLIVKPVTIGANSVIGAGSVVTKSIPPNKKVYGNPGKC